MPNLNKFSHARQELNAFEDFVRQEISTADERRISSIITGGKPGKAIEGAIARITREEWSREASQAVDFYLWLEEQPVEAIATLTIQGGVA